MAGVSVAVRAIVVVLGLVVTLAGCTSASANHGAPILGASDAFGERYAPTPAQRPALLAALHSLNVVRGSSQAAVDTARGVCERLRGKPVRRRCAPEQSEGHRGDGRRRQDVLSHRDLAYPRLTTTVACAWIDV